ncbi:MAG: NAD-dependent deacylase [Anaerolineae bacterium]|nr:NAD-dependent deacylase [Anaerolineae bacterium]
MVQQVAVLLRVARCAVALSGAGISVPSGIPDFRSPGSGLWGSVDSFAVASLAGFRRHPEVFYNWIRPLVRTILQAQPNPAHVTLAQLEAHQCLDAVITQNIDGLHQRAGSRRVYELHGHIRQATCLRCHRVVSTDTMIPTFLETGEIPRCECSGVFKPNVVLFGEMLPEGVWNAAVEWVERCDVLLVVGSSLEVSPAADLPLYATAHGAHLVIVNLTPTPLDGLAEVVIHADVAVTLPRIGELVLAQKGVDPEANPMERL